MNQWNIFFLLGCLLCLGSCSSKNKEIVPLRDIKLELNPGRLDLGMHQAALKIRSDSSSSDLEVYRAYLKPYSAFIKEWHFGGFDSLATDSLAAEDFVSFFLRNSKVMELLDTVAVHFPDSFGFEPRLLNPLKRYHYYFPEKPVPAFYTYVSGYSPSVAGGTDEIYLSEKFLGIGLHYFLGENCEWYPADLPAYLRKRMDQRFLEVMVFKNFAGALLPPRSKFEQPTLLDEIIDAGIKLIFLDKILPESPDSMKIFYSTEQWTWATYWEGRIWRDLMPHLYEKKREVINDYIGENPYTRGLALESAPRIGEFAGWMLLRKYLDNHNDIGLASLFENHPSEKILSESGYKPRQTD